MPPILTKSHVEKLPRGGYNIRMISTARVQVPATSANLGPGFDALGVALCLSNTVTVMRTESPSPDAMADEAAATFFSASGVEPFAFSWEIQGDVPRSRGLGSSVTVRLGLLHGLNLLADAPLNSQALYRLCAKLEGHPDNAAPAAFGGFTVARPDGSYQRFDVDESLKFVLLIPDYEVRTADARRVLPKEIPFADAVRSAANAAAIAAAFAARQYESLPGCFDDYLHQPYRATLVPGLDAVLAAGVKAGAIGGWLSGSGSTMACITQGDADVVAAAMLAAHAQPGAKVVTTVANNCGVTAAGE